MKTPKQRTFSILLGLLGLYWLTRLIEIDSLAVFLDEAIHLSLAQDVWAGHPFSAAGDGRLLNAWWIAVFYPFNANVWIARVSVVFLTIIGLACILAITRKHYSPRAAYMAGLLYIFMPLTFFFERLALADSLSAPFTAMTLWLLSLKVPTAKTWRTQLLWSGLSGFALTCAALSKISNLIFLCLPLLALIFIPPTKNWKRNLSLSSFTCFSFLITFLPVPAYLWFAHQTSFGLSLVSLKTGSTLIELPNQIAATLKSFINFWQIYLPFPMWFIVLIGLGLGVWAGRKRALLPLSCLIITAAILITQTKPQFLNSRFLPVYTPMLLILVGGGLALLTNKWQHLYTTLLTIALIGNGLLFNFQAWRDPTQLSLGEDHWQYIAGWPAGYGFREIASTYLNNSSDLQLVTFDLGSKQKLDAYLLGHPTHLTTAIYNPDMPLTNSLLIVEQPFLNDRLREVKGTLFEVERYYRPTQVSWVAVYRVQR